MPLFGRPNVGRLKAKGKIEALYKALISRDDELMEEAGQALVDIGAPAVGPMLQAAHKHGYGFKHGKGDCLLSVVDVLVAIGPPAVEALVSAVDDPTSDTFVAVSALGRIGDPRGGDALLAVAKDDSAENRRARPVALGAVADLVGPRAQETLIAALDDESSIRDTVQPTAARELGKIGDERAIEPLARASMSEDTQVQAAAFASLGKIAVRLKDASSREAIRSALKRGLDGKIRMRAAAALAAMGDSQGFDVLAAILCSRDSVSTRCLAAWSLGETRTAAAAEALVRALGDELTADSVREALTKIGQPAVKPLLSVLRDGSGLKDPKSNAAAAVLVRVGTPAVGPLVRSLEDGSVQERRWAPLILSQIGDEGAVEPLVAALDDEDPGVRIAAAHALETMVPGASYYRCSRCGKGFKLSIAMDAKTTVMRCRSCGLSVCESCGEWDQVKGSTCARCGATALWEKQLTVPL